MSSLSKQLEQIRKDFRNETDLFKNENKGESYSNLSPNSVYMILNIIPDEFFMKVDVLPVIEISQDLLIHITRTLKMLTLSEGPVNLGNEIKRCDFVHPFLYTIVCLYSNYHVKIRREKEISGEIVTCNVEFVIVDNNSILIVIEAKKQDWDQGRVQNMMQLFTAYDNNIKAGFPTNHIVYGIITTGDTWEIISCQGSEQSIIWKYHGNFQPILTDINKSDEEWIIKLKPLLETINYMLNNSLNKIQNINNIIRRINTL